MDKIFEVIGTPNEEDMGFIKEDKYKDYIKSFATKEKANLSDKYPGTDPRGLKLLEKMLEFNPDKRVTAEDAIKDEYFDDIRILE